LAIALGPFAWAGAAASAYAESPPRVAVAASASGSPVLVDDFEEPGRWSARPADGVDLALRSDAGVHGRALRLDFRFAKGGGYAVIHRDLALDLPENYRFRFRVRGECLPENLEFKLVDSTGANVWWSNQRDFVFPARWDSVALKKRHIPFAWGPAGSGEIRRVAAIEFAVTAGSGGAGSVWLDDLTLEPLPPPGATPPPPVASASSSQPEHEAVRAMDGDSATTWASAPGDARPWLALDFGVELEFGGLVLDWAPGQRLSDYAVEASEDGVAWRTLREVRGGTRARDYLYLPESETHHLRVRPLSDRNRRGCALREITIEPLAFGASLESFYAAIAKDAPRGSYPRGISGEQPYWTVVGVEGNHENVLFGEDGAIETGKASFTVEPFLFADGRLLTWADVRIRQDFWPGHGSSVRWSGDSLALEIQPRADGWPGASSIHLQYLVQNLGARQRDATLFLALRPFQVNPPAQFLNTPGGTAPIRELVFDGRVVRADNRRGVISLTRPIGFGAATFDQGDIVEFLRAGRLPESTRVRDPFEHASGALAYHLRLAPGDLQSVLIRIPIGDMPRRVAVPASDAAALYAFNRIDEDGERRADVRRRGPQLLLPHTAAYVKQAVASQLAYIGINRDGPAIQPGSRSYARSWIRDGSLISSALLRFGHAQEVRDFIEWFSSYQYADGKVPCCVDQRGSDPVPEHDSHGEFIYLVAEYYRLTGDFALLERMWPQVRAAASYLDSLRQERRTSEWRTPDRRAFFGLQPPSISHEGYSAKPMHSYWDDLFALRGFKDAAYIAGELDLLDEQRRLAAIRDEFAGDLSRSIVATMAAHRIDYVPGCADLGDFDATSTTIALTPVQAEGVVPRAALERTFEKYWEFFRDRRDGKAPWEAFTPYEMRAIGAFVRLGWRDRANQLLDFFMQYRRPPGWAQWPEVVWRDERAPHFLGDLPHTWVGSDFLRSVTDMLAYERESDNALVLAAGVRREWLDRPGSPGVSRTVGTHRLVTRYGELDYQMSALNDSIRVEIYGLPRMPAGGIVVSAPSVTATWKATVNGKPVSLSRSGEVVVREAPAKVVLWP